MFADTLKRLKSWARQLKANLLLLWLCCRQPDMPWRPKVVAIVTVAYAVSPIDLIPDFIPVLGFLDDMLLLPLGIALALKMIPAPLLQRCRVQAQAMAGQRIACAGRWIMSMGIVMVWLLAGACTWRLIE
ncbi:MAG: YkvA family protein [Janthinobacterium lividum]